MSKQVPVIPDQPDQCRPVGKEEKSAMDKVFEGFGNWCRSKSLFLLHYCTGCGAIELPPTITSRFDMERVGIQPMVTPRQADILLITGYVSIKTLKRVILSYEQMQGPKYVIGFGSCTINGGMYWNSYATAKRLEEYIPTDTFIAGCMPRPEAVQHVLLELIRMIEAGEANAWKDYYANYDKYLGAQQALFGENWHTPVDVVAEAKHYGLVGLGTEGKHTAILDKCAAYELDLPQEIHPAHGEKEGPLR